MFNLVTGALACAFLLSGLAFAGPATIVHQTQGTNIVRLGADDKSVVWQVVGGESKTTLYMLDQSSGVKSAIRAGKRPFGPAVADGFVLFGAGNLSKKVDVILHDSTRGKSITLRKKVPWIVEPAIQTVRTAEGQHKIQAVWEQSANDNGDALTLYLYEKDGRGKDTFKILNSGPVLRKNEIPAEYHRFTHNEYPEIDGSSVVFQNNEYGTPNIYRLEMKTNQFTRLAPSENFQERPALSGPYTVWEESQKGFAASNESSIFVHDARDGSVRQIASNAGFHYQARIKGKYVIYGAKREPAPTRPSLRVYDLEKSVELGAEKCFTGTIFDWAATTKGLYAAQRFTSDSSRLLFATWEQIANGCH